MFRGFNLDILLSQVPKFQEYYKLGKISFEKEKAQIKSNLEDFLFHDKSLNGSKIQETWFPNKEFDLFISHSHQDEELAIYLAGWLFSEFQIKAFVDSTIWGNSKVLLGKINKEHSWSSEKKETYDYNKVNFASSHVHTMLTIALSMMMDKTECLFFLNTPQSVKPYKDLLQTESPWIYSEIALSKTLRRKTPERLKKELLTESTKLFASTEKERSLKVKYNLDVNHLVTLNSNTLFYKWGVFPHKDKYEALNSLYKL